MERKRLCEAVFCTPLISGSCRVRQGMCFQSGMSRVSSVQKERTMGEWLSCPASHSCLLPCTWELWCLSLENNFTALPGSLWHPSQPHECGSPEHTFSVWGFTHFKVSFGHLGCRSFLGHCGHVLRLSSSPGEGVVVFFSSSPPSILMYCMCLIALALVCLGAGPFAQVSGECCGEPL